ncbi:hypothetical protein KM043_010712 [Ampulex compressa]|nr:hypothetical protein KM043_010712 [Ampulex compressa]
MDILLNPELRKLNHEALNRKREINGQLMLAIGERNYWKNAFLRQKKITEGSKLDSAKTVDSVKKECEDILRATQETTERHFGELLSLYNDTREKVSVLERREESHRNDEKKYEERSLELANLLETLRQFDVSADSICRFTSDALKNLIEHGKCFEESLKELRRLTWITEERKEESEFDLLKRQNLVLREIVRKLKRKACAENTIPEKEHEEEEKALRPRYLQNPRTSTHNFPEDPRSNENPSQSSNSASKPSSRATIPHATKEAKRQEAIDLCGKTNKTKDLNDANESKDKTKDRFDADANEEDEVVTDKKLGPKNDKAENPIDIYEDEGHKTEDRVDANEGKDEEKNESEKEERIGGDGKDASSKILRVESHRNGLFYEEYLIRLSHDREIKIKHSPPTNGGYGRMEIVDNEEEYEEARPGGISILVKNIYAIASIKRTGVNCGSQTIKRRSFASSTQTPLTGINRLARSNFTMLNSEKRAIERGLCNLEHTVARLKSNALGQARTMIGKDSKYLGNDKFFECIKALTQ